MSILIDAETTFIVQGITGREAVNLTRECLDYGAGARIVGGVTPGRLGRDVHGVPVFDTVAQAVAHHGAPIDGSVVTVPPAFTKDAVFEAIENGVKLVVIVTERIPRADVAEMVELADLHDARIIGPNCLGIIVPDVIKMGGIGGPARNARQAYSSGPVGVISRSGGMTTEMSSTLTAAGLGQSTAVSIGGDAIIGSTYAELMPLFEADAGDAGDRHLHRAGRPDGGAARRLRAAAAGVAFMAGRFMDEMPGMSFGHAGTIVEGKEDTATEKIARLQAAGITIAERIEDIPDLVRQAIGGGGRMSLFIDVEVDASVAGDRALAAKLTEVCPVDIYAQGADGTLEIVEPNLDECVLCRLCMDAAPPGTVTVRRLYDDGAPL